MSSTLHKKALKELTAAATAAGVELVARDHGHFQIVGPLLVNYYPFSTKRTAYVAGTTKGIQNVSPAAAVAMSKRQPDVVPPELKDKRSKNTRAMRKRMLHGRKTCKCHWCPTIIDLDTSTVEHIVPLARGGLDNPNNRTLACGPCNLKRGNSMLELNQ